MEHKNTGPSAQLCTKTNVLKLKGDINYYVKLKGEMW